MKTFLINWPDNEIQIVSAENDIELFSIMDEIADPFCAKIYQIKGAIDVRIRYEAKKKKNYFFIGDDYSCKIKPFKFKDDIFEKSYRLSDYDEKTRNLCRNLVGIGRN
jgi:hypothetical protein